MSTAKEPCENCKYIQEQEKERHGRVTHVARDLELLPNTAENGTSVSVCPHCDGDALVLANR